MPCSPNLLMSFSIVDFINENYVWQLFTIAKCSTTLYKQQKEK